MAGSVSFLHCPPHIRLARVSLLHPFCGESLPPWVFVSLAYFSLGACCPSPCLWHSDAAEWAPSTTSFAPVDRCSRHVRFAPDNDWTVDTGINSEKPQAL